MARSSGVPLIFVTSFWKCFGLTAFGDALSECPNLPMNSSNSATFSGSGASCTRNIVGVSVSAR